MIEENTESLLGKLNSEEQISSPIYKLNIDQMYHNELLYKLSKIDVNQKIILHFSKIRYVINKLKQSYANPIKFLELQQNLLYKKHDLFSLKNILHYFGQDNVKIIKETDTQISIEIHFGKKINFDKNTIFHAKGFPISNASYASKPNQNKKIPKLSNQLPRILNIASGSNPEKKIHGANIDCSRIGQPDFICDARNLSIFPNSHFTIVRASHILEHFKPEEIVSVLREWIRVLHEDGELHIAVPNAKIILEELASGQIRKSQEPSFDFLNTTAPIAQIYGLGYEHENTDPRWRHHIIFTYELLRLYLEKLGMQEVEIISKQEDFAGACGIWDDSTNHYSLIIRSRKKACTHKIQRPLSNYEFTQILNAFKQSTHIENLPPLSVIIPVQNEESTITPFLENLLKTDTIIDTIPQREYIIVCNGTTDRSVELIEKFIQNSSGLNIKLISSEPGILNAFHAGICARELNGFIAKLDADCIMHMHAITLMYITLAKNKNIQVTYAEPIPVGNKSEFNLLQFNQWLRSKRLYIHGRCSMYQTNPFSLFDFDLIKASGCKVEDIILSYAFIFYYGIDSIQCTNHAIVYSKPIDNRQDFEKKIERIKNEIYLIEKRFPYFIPLRNILDRKILSPKYHLVPHININPIIKLYKSIKYKKKPNPFTHEWYRLESTKTIVPTKV
jgi:predicted SAM-dependent methyltransferase